MKSYTLIVIILAIIFSSVCTSSTQQSTAVIACLDYAELEYNFNASNLSLAEFNCKTKTIISSPFQLPNYQVDNSIVKASSCNPNITLVLVSNDYIEKKQLAVPDERKRLGGGESMSHSFTWIEDLTSNQERTTKAIKFGFKNIYKCRTDRHRECYNLSFNDEIRMNIPDHEHEYWYCIPINSPSIAD